MPTPGIHRKIWGNQVTDVVRIVEADSDGNWRADTLPAGKWDIVAITFDGRRKALRLGYSVIADATLVANLTLESTTQLLGRVQFEDGRPAANALVAGGLTLVRTDATGISRSRGVPVGNRVISAGVERNPDAGIDFPRLGSAAVQVVPGANNYVVVKLRAVGRIYGKVIDLKGAGIGGVRVAIPVEGGFLDRCRQPGESTSSRDCPRQLHAERPGKHHGASVGHCVIE